MKAHENRPKLRHQTYTEGIPSKIQEVNKIRRLQSLTTVAMKQVQTTCHLENQRSRHRNEK